MDNDKVKEEMINAEYTELSSKAEDCVKDEVAERKAEIRNEDHKKIGLFTVITVISGFVGFIVGAIGVRLVVSLEESGLSFVEFWNQVQKDFSVPASFLMIILDMIFILIAFSYFEKAKKLWKSETDEDEKYELVDKKLSMSIMFSNITYFLNFAFFGFAFYSGMAFVEDVSESWLLVYMRMIDLIVFIATLFTSLAIQKSCVNLTKLMNPEKKGSIYDMKFDKVWYASCDEAERMQIGVASYKAFRTVNNTVIVLLTIFVLASMFFEIGILPIIIVTVIGLVNNITYAVESMKISSKANGNIIT